MPNPRTRPSGSHEDRPRSTTLTTERELIVIAEPSAGLRATRSGVASAAGLDVAPLADVLSASGARIRPLFGPSEARLGRAAVPRAPAGVAAGTELPDLSNYYRVEAPDENL